MSDAAPSSATGGQSPTSLWPLLTAVFLAVCFWGWIFGIDWWNFWWKMTIAGVCLSALSLWVNRGELRREFRFSAHDILLGLLSAVFLYLIFYLGGIVLRTISPVSGDYIGAVYNTKAALPTWAITLLLIIIIAPAEEIFWRGLVQKYFIRATCPNVGLVFGAAIYALVHLWAGNPVLVLAAFVCGLVWGWQYRQNGSLVGVILSHAIWDVAVFIVIPLA